MKYEIDEKFANQLLNFIANKRFIDVTYTELNFCIEGLKNLKSIEENKNANSKTK